MALTKKDIVERLQVDLGLPKSKAIEITECLLEQIKVSLESGADVLVTGFGKFCVKEKAQRRGRNPATGEDAIRQQDAWWPSSVRVSCGRKLMADRRELWNMLCFAASFSDRGKFLP